MEATFFDFNKENGLVFCEDIVSVKNKAEYLYITEVQKLGVKAVFFRRFYKEGSQIPYNSEPSVCIFQKGDNFFDSPEHIDLHAKLWSAGKNEIYVINGKTRVDIINARKPAKVKDNQLSLKTLRLDTGTALKVYNNYRFFAYLFGSGTFWEQNEFKNQLDEKSSPYIFLLEHLMATRKNSLNPQTLQLESATIDKLLVICILIKFLEEIKDDNGKHTLKTIYKKFSISNFIEALQNKLCIPVLNDLANEFNGKIFDKFTYEEKIEIDKADLTLLADFLRADVNIDSRQLFIWKQYDFKYLPAEVISAIYENFIQAEALRQNGEPEKGIVYTPIHLVNLLVDEVMPLEDYKQFTDESFRVLDPACGSGVFLVAAYKRLLQWWAINNSSPEKIKYPSKKVAQKILEDNIFGVDVKETSTLVTIFGLTIALLDKLTPKEIWDNLKFKDLSQENIQQNNFFDWAIIAKEANKPFDLIIGNPPFNIESGKKKEDVLKKSVLDRLDFKYKDIPNNNFALHFFEASMLLAKKVCLIIPSNVLLYSRSSQKFRNHIFVDYTVSKIFDFTHLRRLLFHKTADTPVVAVVVENTPSSNLPIEHTVIKRTIGTDKHLRFEIDYYDRHAVRLNWAIDETKFFVWKTNLLGGGQLFYLIHRLSLLPTLEAFIKSRDKWMEVRGFEGGTTIKIEKQDRIESIGPSGEPVISKNVTIATSNLKDDFMYKPPFMIIDQVLGRNGLSTCFVPKQNQYTKKSHLYYNRDFIGISAPETDEKILKKIYENIRNNKKPNQLNYQLVAAAVSSSCLILTETDINKSDILNSPFPEELDDLTLSETEQILQEDVLNYYIHLGKAISKNSDGEVLHKPVQRMQLESFASTFCNTLNSIYEKKGKSLQVGYICQRPLYTMCQFGFGKKGGLKYEFIDETDGMDTMINSLFPNTNDKKIDDKIEALIKDKMSNSGAIFNRIIRINAHVNGYDCICLIKPPAQRYWLNSIALRDAGDTFIYLKKEGF